jgi:hypothetical protein
MRLPCFVLLPRPPNRAARNWNHFRVGRAGNRVCTPYEFTDAGDVEVAVVIKTGQVFRDCRYQHPVGVGGPLRLVIFISDGDAVRRGTRVVVVLFPRARVWV